MIVGGDTSIAAGIVPVPATTVAGCNKFGVASSDGGNGRAPALTATWTALPTAAEKGSV